MTLHLRRNGAGRMQGEAPVPEGISLAARELPHQGGSRSDRLRKPRNSGASDVEQHMNETSVTDPAPSVPRKDVTVWQAEDLPFEVRNADSLAPPTVVAAAAWELKAIESNRMFANPLQARELLQRVPEILYAPGEFTTTIRMSATRSDNGPAVSTTILVSAVGDETAPIELEDACRQVEYHLSGPYSPFRLQRVALDELHWPKCSYATLIRQQQISVGDPADGHLMPVRFAHPGADAPFRLLGSLLAAAPISLVVSVTPTRLRHAELTALEAAKLAADSAVDDGGLRNAATALDAVASYKTDLFVVQILVMSEKSIGSSTLRAIASSLTAGFDAERHVGQRVVARPNAFVSGGASIEPVRCPADEQLWLEHGLPRRGFGDERELVDLMTSTEIAFSYSFLVDDTGALPGVARQTGHAVAPLHTAGAVTVGSDPFGQPALLPAADRLMHLVVLGATGSGKSTLLVDLIRQDIEQGNTVVILNPSADLTARAAEHIPENRRRHTRYLDAAGGAADSLHLLDIHRGAGLSIEDNVAAICTGMTADLNKDFAGPVWQHLMQNGARACALGGVPLRQLSEMMFDPAQLEEIARDHDDRALLAFAREARDWSSQNRAEYVTWAISKTNWATLPGISDTFDSGFSTFSLAAALDGPSIILVDLGADPGSGALVTSVLLALTTALTNHRTMTSRPMAIYVDEAHRVAGQNLRRVMLEARKRRIALTLATQAVSNMHEDAEVLLGNAGSVIVGRCAGPTSVYAEHMLGVPATTFPRMANFRSMARLTVDGQPRDAIELTIAPPALPVPSTLPDWLLEAAAHRRSAAIRRHNKNVWG